MRSERISRWLAFCALALAGCLAATAQAGDGAERRNLGKGGVALSGFDPVSYFQEGGPKPGDKSYAAQRGEATYLFSSEANRTVFLESPEKFEPEFGGWCAWAMLEGDKVEIDPMRFRIFEGRLLLFYDGFWGNTLEKWNKKAKDEGERTLFESASENWKKLTKK